MKKITKIQIINKYSVLVILNLTLLIVICMLSAPFVHAIDICDKSLTCGRCSNEPGKEKNWVTWNSGPDGICDSGDDDYQQNKHEEINSNMCDENIPVIPILNIFFKNN